MARNPVMFVVWVGSVLATAFAVADPSVFAVATAVWLWATVVFANLAEAVSGQASGTERDKLTQTSPLVVRGRHLPHL